MYTDLNCQVTDVNNTVTTRSLACANFNGGRYGSVQGMCNTNPNRLPLPGNNFVSEV